MADLRSKPVRVDVVSQGPVQLAFDAVTPHQASIKATPTRALASGTTVRVDYATAGTGWIDGGLLYPVKTSEGASFDGFAGWVVDLLPGTAYQVRI
jgi:hypothetical protein